MTPFSIFAPGEIRFGRGSALAAPDALQALGPRGLIVHGATPRHAETLIGALTAGGGAILALPCPTEPTLQMLEAALEVARPFGPNWVAGIGGGSTLDLAKALAALVPAPGGPMDHLEIVGRGLPLAAPPLPFVALPTTAGTGSEATRNAVIGLPDHGRKVSLRDARMLARLAIVDPALTDGAPRRVTLASGLDAVTQVIEPFVSCRATAFTDSISQPAIGQGLRALARLMETEDADARDALAYVSLVGGLSLSNAALGAVHGLAGVIGGISSAPHGAICGALLGPVLRQNRRRASADAARRLDLAFAAIADVLGGPDDAAPETLRDWARTMDLPSLSGMGVPAGLSRMIAEKALGSSSMRGNPVALDVAALEEALSEAG